MKSQAYKLQLDKQKVKKTLIGLKSELGVILVKHFKQSFEKEGFNDEPFVRWQPLKRARKRYANRKILTQTGALKNSMQNAGVLRGNILNIVVWTSKIYAKIHNNGLMGLAFGKYPFRMPKRQFIGNSNILNKKLETRIDYKLKKELNLTRQN